nr:MAG TPA: hypothetical protein [Bacteriophage sp.]
MLLKALPSCEVSTNATPVFLKAIHFCIRSVKSSPNKVGSIDISNQSPSVPLLAKILSLK